MQGIRKRLLIGAAVLAALVLGIGLPLALGAIDRSTRALEVRDAKDDALRLQRMLAGQLEDVTAFALDYGNWALTADYMRGLGDPKFVDDNFYPDNMRLIDADFVFLARPDLRIDTSLAQPSYLSGTADGPDLVPMADTIPRALLAEPATRELLAKRGTFGAFRLINGEWYQIALASITYPGNQPTGILGVLGFVKEIDESAFDAMAGMLGSDFEFLSSTKDHPLGISIVGDQIVSVQPLHDSNQHRDGLVRFAYPRPLQSLIADARNVLVAGIIVIFLLGSMLILFYVDRQVLRRLRRMDNELTDMIQGHASAVTAGRRDDEIDRVATRINALHAELDDTTRRWRHEAHHDALTDLGNRIWLMRVLEDRLADAGSLPLSLLLLDLDSFKPVNDVHGHAVGDLVLGQVAQRIRDSLPVRAQAFRLGGDEFAVVCPGMTEDAALAYARALNNTIASRGVAELRGAGITTSIGIATCRHASSVEELVQHADVAMYEVKRGHRNGAAIYDDVMRDAVTAQRELERDLRNELATNGLQAWYQPIVAAGDHHMVGFEALARWQHPQLGWVPPERFIEIAERTGLVSQIDLLVLRHALDALRAIGDALPEAYISVNVSAQSLLEPHYVSSVPRLLERAGVAPHRLVLELTESLLVANEAALAAPIETLRAQGVGLLLDDFGVGYSSLSRLAQLAPDGIKLDGSFVRQRSQDGDRICRAIIGMASQLQIPVIAEFVASDDDARFMHQTGCAALQGHAISAAMPLPALQAWVAARNAVASPV